MKSENKPIKRQKDLVPLSRDHHEGLLLCWKIRTGLKNEIERERIRNYVVYFFDHDLKEHFRQEEQLVFALLNEDEVMRKEAFDQHKVLYGMVEELRMQKTSVEELLAQFADKLDDHIRFEERKLFPYIETHTDPQRLQEAGVQIAALHQQNAKVVWDDEFWLKTR